MARWTRRDEQPSALITRAVGVLQQFYGPCPRPLTP